MVEFTVENQRGYYVQHLPEEVGACEHLTERWNMLGQYLP